MLGNITFNTNGHNNCGRLDSNATFTIDPDNRFWATARTGCIMDSDKVPGTYKVETDSKILVVPFDGVQFGCDNGDSASCAMIGSGDGGMGGAGGQGEGSDGAMGSGGTGGGTAGLWAQVAVETAP